MDPGNHNPECFRDPGTCLEAAYFIDISTLETSYPPPPHFFGRYHDQKLEKRGETNRNSQRLALSMWAVAYLRSFLVLERGRSRVLL